MHPSEEISARKGAKQAAQQRHKLSAFEFASRERALTFTFRTLLAVLFGDCISLKDPSSPSGVINIPRRCD